MTQHTPGPWRAMSDGSIQRDVAMPAGGAAIAYTHHADRAVEAANARLIAAAPELLELCERLLGVVLHHTHPSVLWAADSLIDRARETIQKTKSPESSQKS